MINWKFNTFDELSGKAVYEMLQLRNEVFVLEQNCPYQDADGKDFEAVHVLGYDENGILVAYCRILKPGLAYATASIGRVVNSPSVRGTGTGRELMRQAVDYATVTLGLRIITISAQSHLQKFYEEFGFKRTPKREYLEDDIPHREMELNVFKKYNL